MPRSSKPPDTCKWGGPKLRGILKFSPGRSACLTRDQLTSENIWVNLSRIILYQMSYQISILIKSIFRSVIVFLDLILNQVEFQYELYYVWETRAERLENLFSNVFVRVHTKSSKTYCYIKSLQNIILNPLRQYIKVLIKLKSRSRRSCSLFSGNMVVCLYKSQTHVANNCKFKLSTDIEKNPSLRLVYVDHIAHIACWSCWCMYVCMMCVDHLAPYSRSHELIYGQNAEQQCFAMSLCCLI